ncbi:MAG: DUF3781 domain-containing protein [Proteobacteria bacterium]|nr:DUF3781 domain-containing protein [Pseudomonadota bacterium]
MLENLTLRPALLHTTELGELRIRRNLGLGAGINAVEWCGRAAARAIKENSIVQNGKNWYIYGDGYVITVHRHSHTIITAHRRGGTATGARGHSGENLNPKGA